jgi:hypothetical protein
MTSQEQDARLAAGYRKMPPEGRDTLDRIVQRLIKIDRSIVRPASSKTSKEGGNRN